MPKLTEQCIAKITVPRGKRDILAFDDGLPGFGVRKFESGKASFFVKYNVGRQQRKITLGPYTPGMLADMRKRAAEVLAKARLGDDVQATKKAARARKVATVGELITAYLKFARGELRHKPYLEYQRYLTQRWRPIHERPIDEVSRTEIVTVIDRIAETSGRTAADRAKTALSAFYSWAIDKGYRDSTPLVHIRRRANGGGRERVLSEGEIRAIWQALGDDDYALIIKLLLLTGQRRNEIGDLQWREIDIAKCQIELPSERTKNGKPHVIPLSAPALTLLESKPRYLGRDHMFGIGSRGFQGWSKSKRQLDGRISAQQPWTVHDIRRTVVTLMNERDIAPPHIVEAIVNHISGYKGGVAGIYNRTTYAREKRRALDAWADHLMKVVAS
jgi:integrase